MYHRFRQQVSTKNVVFSTIFLVALIFFIGYGIDASWLDEPDGYGIVTQKTYNPVNKNFQVTVTMSVSEDFFQSVELNEEMKVYIKKHLELKMQGRSPRLSKNQPQRLLLNE